MEHPNKGGRPTKDRGEQKKPHSLSFTDSEWQSLANQAIAAGAKNPSAFIIKKLKLK